MARPEHACPRCDYHESKPLPFAICPACGYDGRILTHYSEAAHDLDLPPESNESEEAE